MEFKYVPSFNECQKLVNENECFIRKDEIIDNNSISTFAYRIATLEDFNKKGARNLRGITFETNTKKLLALPFHKFWNLNENEYVKKENVENKKIIRVTEKYDGSLIYFFKIKNKLCCKTKLNSFSEQSEWAMNIVDNNPELKESIIDLIDKKYTPLFELISPRNQIVIFYTNEELRYICSRNMKDGTYLFDNFVGIKPVDNYPWDNIETIQNIIQNYYGHEGFVVTFENQDMIKLKTKEYLNLHKIRENILNEKALVELILYEQLDDIRSTLFSADSNMLEYIDKMENQVIKKYNHYIDVVEKYYNKNKNLTRKEYAIKAKKELNDIEFALAMEMFVKEKIDEEKFKERFLTKKLWKEGDDFYE